METRTLGICETQPLTAEGVRAAVAGALDCRWAVGNLSIGMQLARQQPVDLLVLDKGFGLQTVIDAVADLHRYLPRTAAVIWGVSLTEAEALRCFQAGARGILRKTADGGTLQACLHTVGRGGTWMEDSVFHEFGRFERSQRSDLTSRERQVLELVEQGLKNKEIARELGIRPGTVKIHLKHIFEKTGVRGRYGLALNGMRQRTLPTLVTLAEAG